MSADDSTVRRLRMLADRLLEEARAAGVRAAIVVVSEDVPPEAEGPARHSAYGYAHFGPCLDLDGLARRITQATDANWRHSLGVERKEGDRWVPPMGTSEAVAGPPANCEGGGARSPSTREVDE